MADGDNLILGKSNGSTTVTSLSSSDYAALVVGGQQFGLGSWCSIPNGWGIFGEGPDRGVGVLGMGDHLAVVGTQTSRGTRDGAGVRGLGTSGPGVDGYSNYGYGVTGSSQFGGGVYGYSYSGGAIVGVNNNRRAYAGFFWGNVFVAGDFFVGGAKSAVVPDRHGSHRRVYSIESPESWFEDFGSARLVRGRATVKLAPDFATLIRTAAYHVFLTPEGDSNGLYVSRKTRSGFEVREQRGGTRSLRFSYRVTAKRRDVRAPRLARTTFPERPEIIKPPPRPERPKGIRRGR